MASQGNGRRPSADDLARELDRMVASNRSSNQQPSYQATYDYSQDTTYDPVYNSRSTQYPPSQTYPTSANPTSSSGRTTGNRTSSYSTTASYSSHPSYSSNYASDTQYTNNQSAFLSGYTYSNGNMTPKSRTATSNDYRPEFSPHGYRSTPSSAHAGDKPRTNRGTKERDCHRSHNASSSQK